MPRKPRGEGERSVRLQPGRIRRANTSARPITGTAKNLLRLTKLVSRSVKSKTANPSVGAAPTGKGSPFQRRCIVNVRYASSKVPGNWRAHGTYLERESAQQDAKGERVAGNEDRLGLAKDQSLATVARSWQEAGDERIFKIILSPEDAGADFAKTAEAVIARVGEYTGAPVSWGGVVHRNTDHPHAHLILRGRVRQNGPLKLPPEMIRRGLREAVQAALTRQFGPRTIDEIERQRSVELTANRVTPLDRKLVRGASISPNDPSVATVGRTLSAPERTRLAHLEKLGLAKHDERDGWLVRTDTLAQLRQMKDLQDRARILFRSGVAIGDSHAPMEFSSQSKKLIGRVLLNSEDERTGALQTVFETTDGKIEILRHDGILRAAWTRGDLKPGSIVVIDALRGDPVKLYASSAGLDQEVLRDPSALDSLARRMSAMGLPEIETGKGWMGEFSRALKARALERDRKRGY